MAYRPNLWSDGVRDGIQSDVIPRGIEFRIDNVHESGNNGIGGDGKSDTLAGWRSADPGPQLAPGSAVEEGASRLELAAVVLGYTTRVRIGPLPVQLQVVWGRPVVVQSLVDLPKLCD